MHPEARQGGLPGAAGGGKAKTANLAGFAADTAKNTGIAERTIRRAVRRANEIDRTVRDRIRNKPEIADNGIELDTLASMTADDQKQVIEMVVEGRSANVREAKKRLQQPEQAGQPQAGQLEADEAEAEPPWPEAPRREEALLQQVSPQRSHQRYPYIDPFKDCDPPWINGALKLIPRLAEAMPTEAIPNRDAIICGALELIPPLAEAVLELPDIPAQHLIEDLLRYCGYRDYADRVSRHSSHRTDTTPCAGSEDGFDVGRDVTIGSDVAPAARPNLSATAAISSSATDLAVTEASDVT